MNNSRALIAGTPVYVESRNPAVVGDVRLSYRGSSEVFTGETWEKQADRAAEEFKPDPKVTFEM